MGYFVGFLVAAAVWYFASLLATALLIMIGQWVGALIGNAAVLLFNGLKLLWEIVLRYCGPLDNYLFVLGVSPIGAWAIVGAVIGGGIGFWSSTRGLRRSYLIWRVMVFGVILAAGAWVVIAAPNARKSNEFGEVLYRRLGEAIVADDSTAFEFVLEKYRDVKPDDSRLAVYDGWLLLLKGNADSAIGCFTRLMAANPQSDFLYYVRGRAYEKKKKRTEALRNYAQAKTLNPQNLEAARAYVKLSQRGVDPGNKDGIKRVQVSSREASTKFAIELFKSPDLTSDRALLPRGSEVVIAGQLVKSGDYAITLQPIEFATQDRGRVILLEGRILTITAEFTDRLGVARIEAPGSNAREVMGTVERNKVKRLSKITWIKVKAKQGQLEGWTLSEFVEGKSITASKN